MALSKQESALYDRQIRLWGVAAQQRMRDSKILIVGMTALAAEVYLINQALMRSWLGFKYHYSELCYAHILRTFSCARILSSLV